MSKFIGYYESPIGLIEIITDEHFLRELWFVDKIQETTVQPEILKKTLIQLDEYFKELNFKSQFGMLYQRFLMGVW